MTPEEEKLLFLKLRQAAKTVCPDYPDWKRGLIWGGGAAVIAGVLTAVLSSFLCSKSHDASPAAMTVGMAFIALLIAGGIAAFRPVK